MSTVPSDAAFTSSLPEVYQAHLVPLIFEPYAEDVAKRLAARAPSRVLEVAAGTGVVTRQLASTLEESAAIVATDLNQPMLDRAQQVGTARSVEWRKADAMALPFDDSSFDAVVCQFGAMFFPDKAKAFSEARRVLRPGGVFVFSVWDRIDDNDLADAVTKALAELFPQAPPRFMVRTPHGYCDPTTIAHDVARSGFPTSPSIVTVTHHGSAPSAKAAAMAFCQGTPLRNEIEALGASLNETTQVVATKLAGQFGDGAIAAKSQALVVMVER